MPQNASLQHGPRYNTSEISNTTTISAKFYTNEGIAQLLLFEDAIGLYPVLSMHTLRLYQHSSYSEYDEEIRLDHEDERFVVRHLTRATPAVQCALPQRSGVWTKRGPDALALLERAFDHLQWFVSYRTSESQGTDRGSAG